MQPDTSDADTSDEQDRIDALLDLLKIHHEAFFQAHVHAKKTGHPTPSDTRAWSQIAVSILTGIPGIKRKKGPDLADGSDVKGANVWGAIDTPRFNGCLKAGTKSDKSGCMKSLDDMPFLFLVLWDNEPENGSERCRIWVVRTKADQEFRKMARLWYEKRRQGEILSSNFQLHPPRNQNSDEIRNTCGNLEYPLLFEAYWIENRYRVIQYSPEVLRSGACTPA